jgi:hypothetical protein
VRGKKAVAEPGLFESVTGKDWPELPEWSETAWSDVVRKMDEVLVVCNARGRAKDGAGSA